MHAKGLSHGRALCASYGHRLTHLPGPSPPLWSEITDRRVPTLPILTKACFAIQSTAIVAIWRRQWDQRQWRVPRISPFLALLTEKIAGTFASRQRCFMRLFDLGPMGAFPRSYIAVALFDPQRIPSAAFHGFGESCRIIRISHLPPNGVEIIRLFRSRLGLPVLRGAARKNEVVCT